MAKHVGAYRNFLEQIDGEVSTIIELGSRDLLDAIHLSQRFSADVYSWECNPYAIALCKSNLLQYKHTIGRRSGVHLIEKAVWSEPGTIKFFPVTNGNHGASSCFKANLDYPYEQYEQSEIEVECMRVDDWLKDNNVPTPELVCMDLQGAEMEALKSFGDLLHEVQYIITEGQKKPLYHDTPLVYDLAGYLKDYGFELVAESEVNDWFGDYLFVKKS